MASLSSNLSLQLNLCLNDDYRNTDIQMQNLTDQLGEAFQKYALPFEGCLEAIKQNSIKQSQARMRQILEGMSKEVSQECFKLFAEYYLGKLIQLIKTYFETAEKDRDKAIELLIFLDDLTQPQNYSQFKRIRTTALLFLSHYFRINGDDHSSCQVLEQALEVANQINSPFLQGLIHLNLGSQLSKLNDKQQAIKFFKSAIQHFQMQTNFLSEAVKSGEIAKKTQEYIYSYQNLAIAFHNIGIEFEKEGDQENAFMAYFNSYMGARDHLGSSHPQTKSFLSFLQIFSQKLEKKVQDIEGFFENPNSYQHITRKNKKILNPYFETYDTNKIKRASKQSLERSTQVESKESSRKGSIDQINGQSTRSCSSDQHSSVFSTIVKERSTFSPDFNTNISMKPSIYKQKRDKKQFQKTGMSFRNEYHSFLISTEELRQSKDLQFPFQSHTVSGSSRVESPRQNSNNSIRSSFISQHPQKIQLKKSYFIEESLAGNSNNYQGYFNHQSNSNQQRRQSRTQLYQSSSQANQEESQQLKNDEEKQMNHQNNQEKISGNKKLNDIKENNYLNSKQDLLNLTHRQVAKKSDYPPVYEEEEQDKIKYKRLISQEESNQKMVQSPQKEPVYNLQFQSFSERSKTKLLHSKSKIDVKLDLEQIKECGPIQPQLSMPYNRSSFLFQKQATSSPQNVEFKNKNYFLNNNNRSHLLSQQQNKSSPRNFGNKTTNMNRNCYGDHQLPYLSQEDQVNEMKVNQVTNNQEELTLESATATQLNQKDTQITPQSNFKGYNLKSVNNSNNSNHKNSIGFSCKNSNKNIGATESFTKLLDKFEEKSFQQSYLMHSSQIRLAKAKNIMKSIRSPSSKFSDEATTKRSIAISNNRDFCTPKSLLSFSQQIHFIHKDTPKSSSEKGLILNC